MSTALPFLRRHSPKFFGLLTGPIALLLPERLWYPAVLRVSRILAFFLRWLIACTSYRRDCRKSILAGWLLAGFLHRLVALRRPFPIPIRVQGTEVIRQAAANPHGVALCSVHLPLVDLGLRSLVDMNLCPDAVLSIQPETKDAKFPIWGLDRGLPVLLPSDPLVLLKVRNILRRGGSVAALVDAVLGQSRFRTNLLRLVGRVGAQLVFIVSELLPDGDILLEYFAPPDPFCTSDESIFSNLDALQARVDRLLRSPSTQSSVSARPSNEKTSDPATAIKFSGLDSA